MDIFGELEFLASFTQRKEAVCGFLLSKPRCQWRESESYYFLYHITCNVTLEPSVQSEIGVFLHPNQYSEEGNGIMPSLTCPVWRNQAQGYIGGKGVFFSASHCWCVWFNRAISSFWGWNQLRYMYWETMTRLNMEHGYTVCWTLAG